MSGSRLRLLALLAAATAGLSACADDYGYGYASAGYGAPGYYCDPNYYDCGAYGGYGYDYGYADPWYGWYGDYYYPGIGFFVFDRFGHRFRMDRDQRRFWDSRRGQFPGRNWNDQRWQHWDGFRGQSARQNMGSRMSGHMGGHMAAPMGGHHGH